MPGAPIARRHVVDFIDSWATSVLVGLNMHRAGGTDWGKNKVYIREYSPKTMNIVGVRTAHHSANSMYKDDNKISRQQKVLHMNKMLERVPHFQRSFSVGIQPLS